MSSDLLIMGQNGPADADKVSKVWSIDGAEAASGNTPIGPFSGAGEGGEKTKLAIGAEQAHIEGKCARACSRPP